MTYLITLLEQVCTILPDFHLQMSYHRFNNLVELLNGDLTAEIGRGIFSKYLMDRKCNCSLPSKFNGKCAYGDKFQSRCIIYELTCSMCDDIYIGNTQHNFNKIMDGHLSDLKRLLKNGQKSDPFSAHFVQHFNTNTSRTDLRKYRGTFNNPEKATW